jgi:RNA polymerase sigma-70 factor (ECF subfamily)
MHVRRKGDSGPVQWPPAGRTVTKRGNLHLSTDEPGATDYEPLVRAAAAGGKHAMERLLMRAQEVAFRFSLLVCGHAEDAEDVMQEALISTYRYVGRIERPEAFRTWLYRTVTNACRMKRRKRVDEPAHVLSFEASRDDGDARAAVDVVDRAKGPDELALNAWLGARLRRALGSLPPQYRYIVLLRDVEGLSTKEVASVTGLSADNVKTRLHRARVLLREALETR